MPRSAILAIAASVRAIRGREIADFTVGDFDATQFPIPEALIDEIGGALRAGHTNYPPAPGVIELRTAIADAARRDWGVSWPTSSVIVGSGARPPIYAAFQVLLSPGDTVVYPVPCWNTPYYVTIARARGVPIVTRPEFGFMPRASDLAPHLKEARLIVLNSPSNPVGSILAVDALTEICHLIVEENRLRRRAGRPALFLLYDQVYWQLIYDGSAHGVPAQLVPEVAPYTLHVDAISKSLAATGLRVGWVLAPPIVADAINTAIGHMGAWAGRAEQIATARLLQAPERLTDFHARHRAGLRDRLAQLGDGLLAIGDDQLQVTVLPPAAALYLTARFHPKVVGDEALRTWLLDRAGIAVVPFGAFGLPDGSGWVRFSVGAVSPTAIEGALNRLKGAGAP